MPGTDLDISKVREQIARYQKITGDIQAIGLDTADRNVAETAAGLAAMLVAQHLPDLLAALDTAHAALADVRAGGVDPALLRWCDWPGCWAHFEALDGPVGQPSWIRVSHNMLLLCPPHAAAGHIPDWMWDQTLRMVTAECSCGEAEHVTPGNQASVTTWWRAHVQERPVTA